MNDTEQRHLAADRYATALVIGVGPGLGGAVARRLAAEGLRVAISARSAEALKAIAEPMEALAFAADATDPADVARLFAETEAAIGAPEIVVYNPSGFVHGAIEELDPATVAQAIAVSAFGGFLAAREAARRMITAGKGAILFTGATASVKAYARSAPFAMGKFALRALAQSLARELHPKGVHIGHFILDGAIASARHPEDPDRPASLLDADAIADAYWSLLRQPRSAWTWEIELRPWVERF